MSAQNYVKFSAFGSAALMIVAEPEALPRARSAVERVIAEFDRACSRFRDDSEISALNRAAGTPVVVGPVLLDAVEAALRAARLTDGDVDPSVGEALIALGYDRDFEALDRPEARRRRISVARVPGWRAVRVDRSASTITLSPGVTVDLGATAKALAADRAAAAAHDLTGCAVLLALGGDIGTAGPAPGDGWRVRVTDDHRAGLDAPGQWVTIRSGGLATSSTTTRRWDMDGAPVHHLVDPATGWPAAGPWRTVSVTAASCLDANIASTAAVIRGERAPTWLESLQLPCRLVSSDGNVLHLAGWPAEADDLPAIEVAV